MARFDCQILRFYRVERNDMKKKAIYHGVALFLIMSAVILAWFYVRTTFEQTGNDNIFLFDIEGSFQELNEDIQLVQEFVCTMDELTGFTIFMVPPADETVDCGELVVQIYDANGGLMLFEAVRPAADINMLELDYELKEPLVDCNDKKLMLKLEVRGRKGQTSFIRLTKDNEYEDYLLEVNGEKFKSDIGLTLWGRKTADLIFHVVNISFALLLILLLGLYLLIFLKPVKLEYAFLYTAALIGLIYILIIPAGNPSDELRHFTRAYRISDYLLGQGSTNQSEVWVREQDINFHLGNHYLGDEINREYVDNYYHELMNMDYDQQTSLQSPKMWAERSICETEDINYFWQSVPSYFLSALGITFGRWLNLSLPGLFLAGRLGAWVFYLLCMTYVIRKIPMAKEAVFVLAMLPMTIQQMCSISYDGFAMGLSFVITALAVRFMQKQSEKRNGDYVIFVLAQLILLPMKNYGMVPILLLDLMVLVKKNLLRRIFVLLFIVIGLAGFVVAMPILRRLYIMAVSSGTNNVFSLLQNPSQTLLLAFNTLFFSGNWVDNMVGIFINTNLSTIAIYPYFILLGFICFKKQEETEQLSPKQRTIFGVVSLGLAAAAILGMLFFWSSTNELYIAGVQGRYFIPGALAGILALRSNRYAIPESGIKKIVYLTVLMQMLVLPAIFMQFMV